MASSSSAAESGVVATLDNLAAAFLVELEGIGERHDVAFEGGHVCWRRFGEGAPLVLLHGGHGRWLHWARNIRALASRHTVWVPDLPGYGDSDAPVEPSLASLVDATMNTLDTLVGNGRPIALVGFSFGALVAANLAARRGSVTHLALLGPGGHGTARRPRGELRSWREAAQAHDPVALADAMRHNLLMHMLHAADAADAVALHIHTDACLKTRFRSKPISRAAGLSQALDLCDASLLLAWGEHDVTAVPEQLARSLGNGREPCRTKVIAGAGHWVQYERADQTNALLLAWLDQQVRRN